MTMLKQPSQLPSHIIAAVQVEMLLYFEIYDMQLHERMSFPLPTRIFIVARYMRFAVNFHHHHSRHHSQCQGQEHL